MIKRKIDVRYEKKTFMFHWKNISKDDDLKAIDDDIALLEKEIKQLSPVVNIVNDKRKSLKMLKRLKELIIKESSK